MSLTERAERVLLVVNINDLFENMKTKQMWRQIVLKLFIVMAKVPETNFTCVPNTMVTFLQTGTY